MARIERMRDILPGPPDPNYLKNRMEAGWKLDAVEWVREVEGRPDREVHVKIQAAHGFVEEVPFGLRVATDCWHLEEEPTEMDTLRMMLELIVQDFSLPRMAEQLNQKGLLARGGKPWDEVQVFRVLPRLVEVAPRIATGEEWDSRRKQLAHVIWNS
jgi:hypothetical protein